MKKVVLLLMASLGYTQEIYFSLIAQSPDAVLENADSLWSVALREADLDGKLRIKNLSADPLFQTPLVNRVQANFAAGVANADFVILATTLRHPEAWELHVRIYDSGKGAFVQSIFSKYPEEESGLIFSDAAQKTVRYLRQFINPLADIPRTPSGPGGFGWDVALGSGLFAGEWMTIARPLVSFRTGGSYWSRHTLWWEGDWRLNYRLQAALEYQLWMSEPGWEFFVNHSARLFFPVSLQLTFRGYQGIQLGVAPALHYNILLSQPLYSSPEVGMFPAFSLETFLGYTFWFGEGNVALEVLVPTELIIRTPLMIKMNALVGMVWRL